MKCHYWWKMRLKFIFKKRFKNKKIVTDNMVLCRPNIIYSKIRKNTRKYTKYVKCVK